MAKVTLNPAIQEIYGNMAGMVFRRGQRGVVHVMKLPNMSKVKWSAAQREHRRRFALAVGYARAVLADERLRTVYQAEAALQGKRPFDLAVSDYFKGRNLLGDGESQ